MADRDEHWHVHGEVGFSCKADGRVLVGTVRPGGDGVPMQPGEVLLKRGEDGLYREGREAAKAGSSGPVQVATEAYRDGWTNIFGKRQEAGQA